MTLRGRADAYDVTAERMRDHAVQQARLADQVQKLKKAAGINAVPGDVATEPSGDDPAPPASTSLSDLACSACGKWTAYDMPLMRLMGVLKGVDWHICSGQPHQIKEAELPHAVPVPTHLAEAGHIAS